MLRMLPRPGENLSSPSEQVIARAPTRGRQGAARLLRPSGQSAVKASMPVRRPRCKVCRSPNEHDVNVALVSGEAVRSIAARFGHSKSSLLRHYHDCLPRSLIIAQQTKKLTESEFILAEICRMVGDAKRILALAEKAGDLRTALSAVRELRGLYEVMSRSAVPQSNPSAQVNVLVAPDILALRQTLLQALDPFPEARTVVAQALVTAANTRAQTAKPSVSFDAN